MPPKQTALQQKIQPRSAPFPTTPTLSSPPATTTPQTSQPINFNGHTFQPLSHDPSNLYGNPKNSQDYPPSQYYTVGKKGVAFDSGNSMTTYQDLPGFIDAQRNIDATNATGTPSAKQNALMKMIDESEGVKFQGWISNKWDDFVGNLNHKQYTPPPPVAPAQQSILQQSQLKMSPQFSTPTSYEGWKALPEGVQNQMLGLKSNNLPDLNNWSQPPAPPVDGYRDFLMQQNKAKQEKAAKDKEKPATENRYKNIQKEMKKVG